MTKNNESYGTVKVIEDKDGALILPIPKPLLRDFGARSGDTIMWAVRDDGNLIGRFYHKTKTGWLRLLPGRKTRAVKYPR